MGLLFNCGVEARNCSGHKKIGSAWSSRDDDYDDNNGGCGGDDDGDDAQFRSSVSAELKQDLSFEFMDQQEIQVGWLVV